MIRERVHGGVPEIPGFGALDRERVPDMSLVRLPDLEASPWGFRLRLVDVAPKGWISAELVTQIVEVQDIAREVGWEPLAEIEWRDGAMLALTIRADNGSWTWRFTGYDAQRDLFRLEWPD